MTHKAHRYRIAPVEYEQREEKRQKKYNNSRVLKESTSELYCGHSALDTHGRIWYTNERSVE